MATRRLRDVLAFAVNVNGCRHQKKRGNVSESEPPTVPPGGQNFNAESGTRFVPGTSARCALHAKSVLTRWQRCICGEPLIASDLIPLLIQPLQHVPIAICWRVLIASCRLTQSETTL